MPLKKTFLTSKFRIEGIPKVLAKMKVMDKVTRVKVFKAVKEEAQDIIDVAKEITPVKTGALKSTGRVLTFGSKSSKNPQISLTFGGKKGSGSAAATKKFVDYAGVVHETHRSMSKFLETAIRQKTPGLLKRVARKAQIKL